MKIARMRERRKMPGANGERVNAPSDEDHHHDGDELHDVEGLFARFGNALGIFPPEIDGDENGKTRGDQSCHAIGEMGFAEMEVLKEFVEETAEILARRDAADGTGEDVVEHQSGNAEFSQTTAEGLFNGAINAAADEHAAAFDVHRTD